MKYIYESPNKGKTVYKREFNNYNKRKIIIKKENNMEKISLFDYLGRKAGQELGLSVATAAGKAGVPTETRYVETRTYKGDVNLYPKAFLDLYFKGSINESTNKQLLKG